MSCTKLKTVVTLGMGAFLVFALHSTEVFSQSNSAVGQPRVSRLIQSGADIAGLPKGNSNKTVRAGFTPSPPLPTAVSDNASFYRQPNGNDIYPYPTSRQPRYNVSNRSAFAASPGGGSGRLTNQISVGSNLSNGNLGGQRYASNQPMSYNLSLANQNAVLGRSARTSSQPLTNSRAAVEQQRSSTLDSARQSRINQAVSAQRLAFQNQPASRQLTAPPTQQANAYRQVTYQPGNSAVQAGQNCCPPNYTSVTAGYQAAFQAPSISAPIINDGSGGDQSGYSQPALPQCCVPAQGYQYGNQIGTPQFNSQRSRWWTPFFTGSGVYRPLVNLGGAKPGTYLGQGIIGQPTAYVDGQPFRNLLRYISP